MVHIFISGIDSRRMKKHTRRSQDMKFAIFSDIHGNLPALNAVIEDAEKQNVDSFLFLGDYCISNPYPDECIARIRSLDSKYAVRGNEEKYLENLFELWKTKG